MSFRLRPSGDAEKKPGDEEAGGETDDASQFTPSFLLQLSQL